MTGIYTEIWEILAQNFIYIYIYIYISNLYDSYKEKKWSKNLYRTTREILGWKNPVQPSCFISGGSVIRKHRDLANVLQNFYSEKIKKLMSKVKKNGCDPLEFLECAMSGWAERENFPTFNLREISISETLSLISKLGNTTAFGWDNLDALTIKCGSRLSGPHINQIINLSIHQGTYIMKKAGKINSTQMDMPTGHTRVQLQQLCRLWITYTKLLTVIWWPLSSPWIKALHLIVLITQPW